MIQILLLLTLLLQSQIITKSKSDGHQRLVKQHEERESVLVSDLTGLTSKCELYSYLEGKCPLIEVDPFVIDDTGVSIKFFPVKIGGYTTKLTVRTDSSQTWMLMDFDFPKQRFTPRSIYDTLLTAFDKTIFTALEKYLIEEEKFSYARISPPNKINADGLPTVYLEKNGKKVSLYETKLGLQCLFYTKKKYGN
jgi:hypothetical protein